MSDATLSDRHREEIASWETRPTMAVVRAVGGVGDEIRDLLDRPESHYTAEQKSAEIRRLADGLSCLEVVLRGRIKALRDMAREVS